MKNIISISCVILGFWGLISFLSSCAENVPVCVDEQGFPCEEEIDTIPQYPNLQLIDTVGFLTQTSQVRPGSTFMLRLEGKKGDFLMETLVISLNGFSLPVENYTVNGVRPASSTYKLAGDERNFFQWDIEITAETDATRVIYEFQLEDQSFRTDGTSITIDTKLTSNSPPRIIIENNLDTIKQGQKAVYKIDMDALGSPIDTLAIYKAENLFDMTRVYFGGTTLSSNPLSLIGQQRYGFSDNIEIEPEPVNTVPQSQVYTLILIDSLGISYSSELLLVIDEE